MKRSAPGSERPGCAPAQSGKRSVDGSYDTSSADVTLELMDDNWRVLERYSAHSAELDVSTQERASGELRLTPHHSPGVGQVRAGGGVLRFEINC
ncbi:hypothetical protein F1654_05430 [Alkalicaulis satelles]|uniref:Uncharacterized protein n=1 Tax=Alkalicaulis satelles TaxID=2609175 RepID=A0A5M6ZSW8_9PROT|nr:hypothetical protein [Alkalicaulis satelles]KAA5805421.1 hypothetical protein F1654_05430 [Alkalicaulis satelles]